MNHSKFPGFPIFPKPIWLIFCVGMLAGIPKTTLAQDIAILKSAEIEAYSEAVQAFKQALPAPLHITLEYNLQGDITKGRTLARKILASNANLVLAVGLKAALAAKSEILEIPVIVCLVLDPERYGLPTNNMVGLSLHIPFEQQFRPLQTLLPHHSRIGVLFDPQKTQRLKDRLEHSIQSLGFTLISREIHSEQEIFSAWQSLKDKVDALYLVPDSTVLTENSLDFLISSTLENHIPLIGFSVEIVRSGAVAGAYLHYADLGRHAAILALPLLTGSTSSIVGRMVPPTVVHHAINLNSARYLGLSLTPETLRFFDEQY